MCGSGSRGCGTRRVGLAPAGLRVNDTRSIPTTCSGGPLAAAVSTTPNTVPSIVHGRLPPQVKVVTDSAAIGTGTLFLRTGR